MVTGEDTEMKQSASSSSSDPKPKPTETASGGICYWPEQSCDSLPPLPGKVAAGLVGGRGMEFSVNEECELCLGYIITAAQFCAAILFESSSSTRSSLLHCHACYILAV